MAKPNLQEESVVTDPLLSDNFLMRFARVPGSSNGRALELQCRTAMKPGYTIEEVEVAIYGHVFKHVGRYTTTHETTIEFVENRQLQILTMLEEWGRRCRDVQTQHGSYKLGNDGYAVPGSLTIFDQKGTPVATYTMMNMWPSALPDMQFDGQSSTLMTLSTTFKFDWYQKEATPQS